MPHVPRPSAFDLRQFSAGCWNIKLLAIFQGDQLNPAGFLTRPQHRPAAGFTSLALWQVPAAATVEKPYAARPR